MPLKDRISENSNCSDTSKILVSVVMAVYNGRPHIDMCLKSILNQTHENLEIIVVDDCSTDGTDKILSNFQNNDDRISILKNEINKGAAVSRNIGISKAKGSYIAIADADDIYFSNRIEKQLDFLISNHNYHIVFGDKEIIDRNNRLIGGISKNTNFNENDLLRISLLFKNEFLANPLAFFDSRIKNEFTYDDGFPPVEDFRLWIKLIDKFRIYILQEKLMYYRDHQAGISKNNLDKKRKLEIDVSKKALIKLQIDANQRELEMHYALSKSKLDKKIFNDRLIVEWIERLKSSNTKCRYSPSYHFNNYVNILALNCCIKGLIRGNIYLSLMQYLIRTCSFSFIVGESLHCFGLEIRKRYNKLFLTVLKRKINLA